MKRQHTHLLLPTLSAEPTFVKFYYGFFLTVNRQKKIRGRVTDVIEFLFNNLARVFKKIIYLKKNQKLSSNSGAALKWK